MNRTHPRVRLEGWLRRRHRGGGDAQSIAASLRDEPRFQVLGQEKLSEVARPWNIPSGAHYDVHPEGHRFLVLNMRSADREVATFNVVLNWFDEIKARVPTGTGQ